MSLVADVSLQVGVLGVDVSLRVGAGEVLALLGPNGAGKTTVLRALGGLAGIDAGRVELDGVPLADPARGVCVPPERRPIGMVFQDYLLFPHMKVVENVAFGPRARGVAKREARRAALGLLERVGIADLAESVPSGISGGQAQRVALARALATDPKLLLLDEPLAALDIATRAAVRRELRRHLGEFDGATVLVTHDPLDALALADRVAVIEGGKLTQEGTLAEVTSRPRTPYVAQLFGVNLLEGVGEGHVVSSQGVAVATAVPVDGPTLVLIRPASIALHRDRPDSSARNQWLLEVAELHMIGERVRVHLGGALDLVAEVTPDAVAEFGLAEGGSVWASVKATDVTAYPA